MSRKDFDFDRWRDLAQQSPEEFERQRRVIVEQLIEDCNDTRRLRGLQSRIDLERARTRTPMKSCLRLSSLMWDRFLDFNEVLNDWMLARERMEPPVTAGAEIIPFRSAPASRSS